MENSDSNKVAKHFFSRTPGQTAVEICICMYLELITRGIINTAVFIYYFSANLINYFNIIKELQQKVSLTQMTRAIFYTHQTNSPWAGVYACDRRYQMEKTGVFEAQKRKAVNCFWVLNTALGNTVKK